MSDGEVRETVVECIHHVELDRSQKRNALTPALLRDLAAALTRFDDDPLSRVALLTFSGEHACAGLDLPLFGDLLARGDTGLDPAMVDPFGMKRRCRKPVVAAVQGAVFTAGIELMLAADVVVAAQDSRFAQAEVARGLAPFGGATERYVQRAGWGNAMSILLSGAEYGVETALRFGFVQEIAPVGKQKERARQIAVGIAAAAPLSVRSIKTEAQLFLDVGQEAAFASVPETMRRLAASSDLREAVHAFEERREPRFSGC